MKGDSVLGGDTSPAERSQNSDQEDQLQDELDKQARGEEFPLQFFSNDDTEIRKNDDSSVAAPSPDLETPPTNTAGVVIKMEVKSLLDVGEVGTEEVTVPPPPVVEPKLRTQPVNTEPPLPARDRYG